MGFIRRQADLIAAIAATEKLSATQKLDAYEALVTENHHVAGRELLEELLAAGAEEELENRLAEELDGLLFCAAYLNRLLTGTDIKWDGSDVGTKKWIKKNRGYISDKGLADLDKLFGPGAAD